MRASRVKAIDQQIVDLDCVVIEFSRVGGVRVPADNKCWAFLGENLLDFNNLFPNAVHQKVFLIKTKQKQKQARGTKYIGQKRVYIPRPAWWIGDTPGTTT